MSTYPSSFALGHRVIADILLDPVLVEEKIDGSQFSFGVYDENGERVLRCRSKGAAIRVDAPEPLFRCAVEIARALSPKLHDGWVYHSEFLLKPKHNVAAYTRIPEKHLMLFDVDLGGERYLPWQEKAAEADRLGLEVVPRLYEGMADVAQLRALLNTTSVLGGTLVEGIVVKNTARFTARKKIMIGKVVSEAFREIHAREWGQSNQTGADVVLALIAQYRTVARWEKAVQHARDAGALVATVRDIGALIRDVVDDVERECADDVKDALYAWAWPKIQRGLVRGLPEWYKARLAASAASDSDEAAAADAPDEGGEA